MKKLRAFTAAFAGDLAVLAFAVAAAAASFSAEPADAYHFPRLSSFLLLVFCALNAAVNFRRRIAPPLPLSLCRRLLPGAAMIAVYIALAEWAGFYISSAAVFALLAYYYGKNRRPLAVFAATMCVTAGLYLLFGVLLQVQTPEPFWVE